jgi:uncharacterized protein (TIGR03083 family)
VAGVDHEARVAAAERELGTFVEAVAAGLLDAPVPTCPDFTVDDLATHVGQFCGFWTHVLCEGTGRPKPPFDDAPDDRVAWLREVAHHLDVELRTTPPDTAVWTWFPSDQSAGFVARRIANELAVHRVDAELARGTAAPVAADLAADGIEEIFVLLQHPEQDGLFSPTHHTLHLHGTDFEPAEWFVDFGPDGLTMTREHAKGDLALRGAVSDLEMVLYQRPPVGEVQRFGDDAALAAFHQIFTF